MGSIPEIHPLVMWGRSTKFDLIQGSRVLNSLETAQIRCRDMAIRVCWGHMEPPFWEEGEVVGVSDDTIRKSDGGFL